MPVVLVAAAAVVPRQDSLPRPLPPIILHSPSLPSLPPTPSYLHQPTGPGFRGGDVVVVSALRTPLCKAKRGAFKSTTTDDLLAPVLAAVVKQSGIDTASLGDIVIGNVLQPGAGAVGARMAQFYAGIPYEVREEGGREGGREGRRNRGGYRE